MDVIYTTDTQSEIDSLFASSPVQEVKVEEEVKEEPVKPEPTWYTVDKVYMDDLFEAMDEMDTAELLEESAQVVEEEVITEVPEVVSQVEVEEPKSYMDILSDTLSYTAKRLDKSSGQMKMTEQEALFDNFQAQLDRMKRTILENTVVSGIGQGGDGQTPGSGEVRFAKLDDVVLDGISIGDTIIWDGINFVPGAPGTGGGTGTVTTADVNLTNPSTGNFSTRATVLHPNFPMAGDYTTQEDANNLFTECLNYLELGKAHISVGPDIPDDAFVTIGDLYVDETYDMFVFNGNTWVQVGGGGAGGTDQEYVDEQLALKVDRAGDTMNGDLEFKSLTAENYLKISSMRPDGWTSSDALFGLEINLADGNTYKNQLRVRGRSNKEIVRMWIQDEQRIETNAVLNLKPPSNLAGNTTFFQCRDTNNDISLSVGVNGAVRAGTSEAPFIATDDHHLVTKKFSDERLLDVQNQIDNLEASNLSTTTLNYVYKNTTPAAGEFTTNNASPGSVVQFNINTRDSANRVLPTLNTNDVITTRLATGTAPVQTFTVADGSNPAAVTVVAQSTTANNYVDGETYILTIGHSFDGFATTEYVDTKVAITGDTMTGPLILSGDPGTGLQAATKDYVDTTVANNVPIITGYVKADGSVPMTGTLSARNVQIENNASLLFAGGSQYIKVNNGRTLGIYGYSGSSFTNSYTRNIEVSHSNTDFIQGVVRTHSNLISVRNSGYAFEVKPGDVETNGYWNTNGSLLTKGAITSSVDSNQAFRVLNNGSETARIWADGTFDTTRTSFADQHLVTRLYVDEAIAAIPEPQVPATAIAGKRFGWRNNSTPLTGQLSYFSIGETTSGVAMRVHFDSRDGRWAINKDHTYSNLSALFGIYYLNNGVLTPIRTGIVYEMRWQATQQYCYMKIGQHTTNGSFNDSTDYYLTVGGLF